MTLASIRSQISSAVTIVVQLQRLPDGKRRLMSVSEITGIEDDVIQMQEIYRFVKKHTDEKGNILGNFRATGVRPKFVAELKAYGIALPEGHFDLHGPFEDLGWGEGMDYLCARFRGRAVGRTGCLLACFPRAGGSTLNQPQTCFEFTGFEFLRCLANFAARARFFRL